MKQGTGTLTEPRFNIFNMNDTDDIIQTRFFIDLHREIFDELAKDDKK